ncbi:VCBS repeat-containing protein [bacterium]|nr:VCBS repeat-containing protein [bacterium]
MTASLDTVAPVTFDLTNAEAPPPPPPPVIRTAVGAGSGGAPAVKVIDSTGTERLSLLAYVADFTGGVRVATADFTGDGVDDVVTGAGPLGSSHVKVFDGVTGAELRSFFAYDPSARYGVFVAAADLDGDGVAELVTGAGEGGAPHVKVFRYADLAETASFFAFDPAQRGGVSVAAQTGLVVAGSGVGAASEVRVFAAGAFDQILTFSPFGGFTGGVNVTADNGLIEVGAGPGGGPQVKIYTATGTEVASFFPFDPVFTSGVSVASRGGDDPRLIVGAGPGTAPWVVEYDFTQQVTASYLAFDPGFAGGVFVG